MHVHILNIESMKPIKKKNFGILGGRRPPAPPIGATDAISVNNSYSVGIQYKLHKFNISKSCPGLLVVFMVIISFGFISHANSLQA